MSYETLDAIADSYIPILLVLFLMGFGVRLYRDWPNCRATSLHVVFLLLLLITSYGLMFMDKAWSWWPALGLDYSTHTAVALSLVFALGKLAVRFAKWFVISMLAYVALMLYQEYHSIGDIVSTAVIICLCALLLLRVLLNRKHVVPL